MAGVERTHCRHKAHTTSVGLYSPDSFAQLFGCTYSFHFFVVIFIVVVRRNTIYYTYYI